MRKGIERRVPGRAARRAGRARPRHIFLCLFPLSSFYFSFVIFLLFLCHLFTFPLSSFYFSFVRRERVAGDRKAPV